MKAISGQRVHANQFLDSVPVSSSGEREPNVTHITAPVRQHSGDSPALGRRKLGACGPLSTSTARPHPGARPSTPPHRAAHGSRTERECRGANVRSMTQSCVPSPEQCSVPRRAIRRFMRAQDQAAGRRASDEASPAAPAPAAPPGSPRKAAQLPVCMRGTGSQPGHVTAVVPRAPNHLVQRHLIWPGHFPEPVTAGV